MADEMAIFTRTYDFISWLVPLTLNFPRSQRFVVTSRLQSAALVFQERLVEANSRRARQAAAALREADAELTKVRLYLRLCERWEWMSSGQYRHASAMVAEIGRLLGGWMKTVMPEPKGSS
ncbi:MAG: diversity-generating retroelement protein Avd [Chloroflexi bacterium]|nr:diversity-generating retroelement protein Avd [Chloroflexota bacterium]MCL5273519.1 diversity-generating retroelement protein Avd [Chloroflexota bacterium]